MDSSLLGYFYHADVVVKAVMLLLLGASIFSWMLIFQRALYLKSCQRAIKDFEKSFWSTHDISSFYASVSRQQKIHGLRHIFKEGFKAFLQADNVVEFSENDKLASSDRAMKIAILKENNRLEKHLTFLASVGSVSPYIGLFGTVWGIMNAFQALSHVEQVSIAMVAPGISEALIATAMGLFTAIPAVLAYNRYVNQVDNIQNQYDVFKSEFSALLQRQLHHESH